MIEPTTLKNGKMVCSEDCAAYVRNDPSTGDCKAFGGCVVFHGQDSCMPWYWREVERLRAALGKVKESVENQGWCPICDEHHCREGYCILSEIGDTNG